MPLYRKIALVPAEQFAPAEGKIPEGVFKSFAGGEPWYYLQTLEGIHEMRDGDYVCTGVKGERWNVEKTIFESTYEWVQA